jgi:hypothetical protein
MTVVTQQVHQVDQVDRGPRRKLDFSSLEDTKGTFNETFISPSIETINHNIVNQKMIEQLIRDDSSRATLGDRIVEQLNPPTDLRDLSPTPTRLTLVPNQAVETLAVYVKRERKYCKNYCLGLSYIPIIGTLPSIISQCILTRKLKKVTDSGPMIELLKRVNQFKVASIVRTLLNLAAAISVLAFGILTGGIALGIGIGLLTAASLFGLGLVTLHAIQLQTNRSEIKALMSQTDNNSPEASPKKDAATQETAR